MSAPVVTGMFTVTVPWNLFPSLTGSEKLYLPAVENAQLALCPAATGSGERSEPCRRLGSC